jgi:hypothetical protein
MNYDILDDPQWTLFRHISYIWYEINNLRFRIKMKFQKIFRGYSDDEIWELHLSIAEYVSKRLKIFRYGRLIGYPSEFRDIEQWYESLDAMIEAFDLIIDDQWDVGYETRQAKINKGLSIFAKYFQDLWD